MITVVVKREIIKREREVTSKRNKGCTVQLLITCCPVPIASLSSDQPPALTIPPKLYSDHDSMEYPLVQFRAPVLAVLPPNFLCTFSLAEHRKLQRSLTWGEHSSATTKTSACDQHYFHSQIQNAALSQLLGRK